MCSIVRLVSGRGTQRSLTITWKSNGPLVKLTRCFVMLWKLDSTGSAFHRLRAQLRLSQGSSSCMINSTSSSRSSHSFFLLVASSVLSHQGHFVENSARSYELLAELMNVILVENILYHPFYWKPRVLTLGSVGFFAFLECAHDFTSLHVNDISVILCPQTVSMSHTTCCCQVMVDSAILASRVIIDRVHDVIPLSDGLVEQLAQPDLLACGDSPATPTCCQLLNVPFDPLSTATFIHMRENALDLIIVSLHRILGVAGFGDLLSDIVFLVQQLVKGVLAIRVRESDLADSSINALDGVHHSFLACGSSVDTVHNNTSIYCQLVVG